MPGIGVYVGATYNCWILSAPVGLSTAAASGSQMDLSWTNISVAGEGVSIERSSDGVTYSEIGTVALGVSSYSDNTYNGVNNYYYRIRAYKGITYSAYSNIVRSDAEYFITTWDTEGSGSATRTIEIPTSGAGYDCYINWCDGGAEQHVTGTPGKITKVYASTGIKTVKIRGVFPRIYFGDPGGTDSQKILTIENWGTGVWSSFAYAFSACIYLHGNYSDVPNTSSVTDMQRAFSACWEFNSPVNFDTSSVTTMSNMFRSCFAFNQPVNFNTINVTDMFSMFLDCYAFNQPVNFDTRNVAGTVSFGSMFQSCRLFNQPINFNSDKVTGNGFVGMLSGCRVFNSSVTLNTALATSLSSMFDYAYEFNQPISFNTANVTNMSYMFRSCYVFNQPVSFNTIKVTNMQGMFDNARAFDQHLSFNLVAVTNMIGMFTGSNAWSTDNYSSTLVTWANATTTHNTITFDAGDATYSAGAAATARAHLALAVGSGGHGWTISDGGQA